MGCRVGKPPTRMPSREGWRRNAALAYSQEVESPGSFPSHAVESSEGHSVCGDCLERMSYRTGKLQFKICGSSWQQLQTGLLPGSLQALLWFEPNFPGYLFQHSLRLLAARQKAQKSMGQHRAEAREDCIHVLDCG